MKPLDPRLLKYSKSSRGFLFTLIIIAVLSATATITQAFLLTKVIVSLFQRHLYFSQDITQIRFLASIFIFRALLSYLNDRISATASIQIRSELRKAVILKTFEAEGMDSQEFGNAKISVLITKGISNLDAYFARFIPQLFISIVVPLLVGTTIAIQDIRSGLIVLLTIPLIPIFGILIGRYTAAATSRKWQSLNLLSGYFLDLLNGLMTLRVYGRHKLQAEKLQKVGDNYREETMKVLRISFLSTLALELIATLSVALLAVTIGLRLVSGSITLETGLFILIIAPEVYWPIRQVSSFFHAASDGLAAFDSIYRILERPINKGNTKFNKVFAISWSELSIEYENRSTVIIPSGQITIGELHSVVGPSGIGKSTLASVILGFTKVASGEVLLSTDAGAVPLNEVDIELWRSKIAWLPQEPKFPIGTVAQVLRHAKPQTPDFELIAALKSVDLDIANLPNGLRTELGSIKQPISIGQQRKIALARALLKDSDLMILDEPTASVDDMSEATIQKVIAEVVESGKAVLLITHRLSHISANASVTDMARSK